MTNNLGGGVLGGGQLGYNYSLTPMFLVGLETDFQGTSMPAGTGAAVRIRPAPGTAVWTGSAPCAAALA